VKALLAVFERQKFFIFALVMKTIIVSVPEKEENFFIALLKKFNFKSKVLTDEDLEDKALAKWIDEGMKSEDVPEEEILEVFRKHGIKV
jgi:hypothetical protein